MFAHHGARRAGSRLNAGQLEDRKTRRAHGSIERTRLTELLAFFDLAHGALRDRSGRLRMLAIFLDHGFQQRAPAEALWTGARNIALHSPIYRPNDSSPA